MGEWWRWNGWDDEAHAHGIDSQRWRLEEVMVRRRRWRLWWLWRLRGIVHHRWVACAYVYGGGAKGSGQRGGEVERSLAS